MKAILYDWGGLNIWLFRQVNAWHADWLDYLMQLASRLADHQNFSLYITLMAVAALWLTRHQDRSNRRSLWISVLAVFALGNLIDGMLVGMLKEWFAFPRPPVALPPGAVHLVGQPEMNLQHSLPSGHASFAMLVSASLWPVLNRHGRYAAVFFVVWVGMSRISLGVHFPADVVAGGLSCLLIVLLLRKLAQLSINRT